MVDCWKSVRRREPFMSWAKAADKLLLPPAPPSTLVAAGRLVPLGTLMVKVLPAEPREMFNAARPL
jgi:hypothetical protein